MAYLKHPRVKNLEDERLHQIDVMVGEKVRALRLVAGITQQELAVKTNLTFQQIQKYEKGINRISVSRAWDICNILNVDINMLFTELPPTCPEAEQNKNCDDVFSRPESLELLNLYYRINCKHFTAAILNMMRLYIRNGKCCCHTLTQTN